MSTNLPPLLTLHDVAEWLGQPAHRVRRMARRGELPSVPLPGGEILFDAADLTHWVQSRRRPAPSREVRNG
jgi:excisionase family DNA binding protein